MGWIPFWNLHPLRQELMRSLASDVNIHAGVPSQVNQWLRDGTVSLAPCSSVCLLRPETHEVAAPIGVASTGRVGSVYFGFHRHDGELVEAIRVRHGQLKELMLEARRRHPKDMRSIARYVWERAPKLPQLPITPPRLSLTPSSAASANLARILFYLWFGEPATETRSLGAEVRADSRRPVELLIGDEALAQRVSFAYTLDLGELWHDLTELPFVYAVWQRSPRLLSSYWREQIIQAARRAQTKMQVEPSDYMPEVAPVDGQGRQLDLKAYWKLIQYDLTPAHFRGLTLYLCLTRCLQPQLVTDQSMARLLLWESDAASNEMRV